MKIYTFPTWHTQGGGLAARLGNNYIFVEKPACPGFDVGDVVPGQWGLAPANALARQVMEDEIEGLK